MHHWATTSPLLLALVLSVTPFVVPVALAQMDAGYLANVEDRKITTSYSASDRATDVSLALVPLLPDGAAGVTFVLRGRFSGRTPTVRTPPEITLRVHYRVLSDDRQRAARAFVDTYALHVRVDVDGGDGITLPFFPTNFGYAGFKIAGDEMPVLWFTMTPADLRALALADRLSGRVLWSDFFLTDAQVDALRDFAARVLPQGT